MSEPERGWMEDVGMKIELPDDWKCGLCGIGHVKDTLLTVLQAEDYGNWVHSKCYFGGFPIAIKQGGTRE